MKSSEYMGMCCVLSTPLAITHTHEYGVMCYAVLCSPLHHLSPTPNNTHL